MIIWMCVYALPHIHIYSVSYLSSVHILIFFKRSLKVKEMLSIESDRFPLILTVVSWRHSLPRQLLNAKRGLFCFFFFKKKNNLTSHLTRASSSSSYQREMFSKCLIQSCKSALFTLAAWVLTCDGGGATVCCSFTFSETSPGLTVTSKPHKGEVHKQITKQTKKQQKSHSC